MSKAMTVVSKEITKPVYQNKMMEMLQDENEVRTLTTSICSALMANPDLNTCDPNSVFTCAIMGAGLKLTPSPQMGRFYMVPFTKNKGKANETKLAQFILGYKGYLELAKRTGNYKHISVVEVKEGEFKRFNKLTEELEVDFIDSYVERSKLPTIGYAATFVEMNGFTKTLYWDIEQMYVHADKYSPAFSYFGSSNKVSYPDFLAKKYPAKDEWKYSSFWYKDFDEMAKKTMLRQLISKWGNMSVEMQQAYADDSKLVNSDGTAEYLDDVVVEETFDPFSDVIEAQASEVNVVDETNTGELPQ